MEMAGAILLAAALLGSLPYLVLGRPKVGRLTNAGTKACPHCGLPTDAVAGVCQVCDYEFPQNPVASPT